MNLSFVRKLLLSLLSVLVLYVIVTRKYRYSLESDCALLRREITRAARQQPFWGVEDYSREALLKDHHPWVPTSVWPSDLLLEKALLHQILERTMQANALAVVLVAILLTAVVCWFFTRYRRKEESDEAEREADETEFKEADSGKTGESCCPYHEEGLNDEDLVPNDDCHNYYEQLEIFDEEDFEPFDDEDGSSGDLLEDDGLDDENESSGDLLEECLYSRDLLEDCFVSYEEEDYPDEDTFRRERHGRFVLHAERVFGEELNLHT